MIDRLPRDGEVLLLKRRLSQDDVQYKISNVNEHTVSLFNVTNNRPANEAYQTSYFTDNNGKCSHGEWFFHISDVYSRHVCECGSSYVVAPGETPAGKCDGCN